MSHSLALYNDEDDEEKKLPVFKRMKITDKSLYSEEKATQPPQRYSEAGLVKLMETTGIGRPSSYSRYYQTLKKREYIKIDKKRLYTLLIKGLNLIICSKVLPNNYQYRVYFTNGKLFR